MASAAWSCVERYGQCRQAQEAPFDGGGDRSGIEHIVPEVRPVIDPRDHHVVRIVKKSRDGQMDAIRRGAGHKIDSRLGFEHAQRHVQGQRVTGTTAVAIRSHDGDLGKAEERLAEAADPLRSKAVVVADQYFQEVFGLCVRESKALPKAHSLEGASLYCGAGSSSLRR